MTGEVLTLSYYVRAHFQRIRGSLLDAYSKVYVQKSADPFHSVTRFEERLEGHASRPSWACVLGEIDGQPVGFAYGRRDSIREWQDILHPMGPEVRHYGSLGTFGLCDIMVCRPWRGKGIARGMHDELMSHQSEDRASLLVDSQRPKVRSLYESWGYRKVGQMQPFSDSPLYDAMVLHLR